MKSLPFDYSEALRPFCPPDGQVLASRNMTEQEVVSFGGLIGQIQGVSFEEGQSYEVFVSREEMDRLVQLKQHLESQDSPRRLPYCVGSMRPDDADVLDIFQHVASVRVDCERIDDRSKPFACTALAIGRINILHTDGRIEERLQSATSEVDFSDDSQRIFEIKRLITNERLAQLFIATRRKSVVDSAMKIAKYRALRVLLSIWDKNLNA